MIYGPLYHAEYEQLAGGTAGATWTAGGSLAEMGGASDGSNAVATLPALTGGTSGVARGTANLDFSALSLSDRIAAIYVAVPAKRMAAQDDWTLTVRLYSGTTAVGTPKTATISATTLATVVLGGDSWGGITPAQARTLRVGIEASVGVVPAGADAEVDAAGVTIYTASRRRLARRLLLMGGL